MTQRARVLVVTVTFHSEAVLEPWFAGIGALADSGAFDLRARLVDNASGDGTVAAARRLAARVPCVEILEAGTNAGWSAGNNLGLREPGDAEFCLLLNPDVVVDAADLRRMIDALRNAPDAGAAVPTLRAATGSTRAPVFPQHTLADAVLGVFGWRRGRCRRAQRAFAGVATTPLRDGYAEGSCLLLRRAALDAVAPLDERFHLFFDDADLSRRLADRGFTLLHVGAATARELADKGSRAAPDGDPHEERARRFLAHLRSEILYYGKWHGPGTARRLALYKRGFELSVRGVSWRLRYGVRGLARRGRAAVREALAPPA